MKYSPGAFDRNSSLCKSMHMLSISSIRKSRGLTQAQLADKIGISQAHISRLERGDDSASLKLIAEIAQALGVRPSDLLEDRSSREMLLIEAFRSASPEAQAMILGMASAAGKVP